MASRANPWAQGMANLGTALFGSAQEDAALAQAQAEMARRQKLMSERRIAEQKFGRQQDVNDWTARTLGALFEADPASPGYQSTVQQHMGRLASNPVYLEDPEALSQMATLFTNMAGGTPGQVGRTMVDPGFVEGQIEREDAMRRQERLADVFGPEAALLMGGGDAPDFMQRAGAISSVQGIPFEQALAFATGQYENMELPTGDIMQVNTLQPSQSRQVYTPRDQFRAQMDLPLLGAFSPTQQVGAVPGSVASVFDEAPVDYQVQQPAAAQGTPAAGQGQRAPQQQPAGAQARPAAPQQQAVGAQQPPTQARSAPQEQAAGQQPQVNVVPVSQNDPEFNGAPSVAFESPLGSIKTVVGEDSRPLTLFDTIAYTGGLGNVAQRAATATFGQLAERFNFSLPEVARAKVIDLNAELRRLDAVSSRPSQWELAQLEPKFPGTGIFDNPRRNAIRLAEIYYNLEAGKRSALQKLATQPLDPETQESLANGIRHAETVMAAIGEPRPVEGMPLTNRFDELFTAFRGGSTEAKATLDSIFERARNQLPEKPTSGADVNISDEEREAFNNLSPEDRALLLGEGG